MKITNAAEARQVLMNRRPSSRPRAEVPAPSIDGATATIRLFDPIDSWGEWWGMSAKELAAAVDALPAHVTEIRLLINSPGGDAFEGMAMVNVLRAHSARIVAVVQGLAASAASFIAASADETIMAPNSTMMIHCAWGVCVGNADDMVSMAGILEQIDGNLADIYAAKAGGDVEIWRDAMKAETWYTAAEAVAVGLADRIEDATAADGDGSASAQVDGSRPQAGVTEIADPVVDDWASEDSDALELLSL